MIIPARTHPRFNVMMEALCLLARHPIAVPLYLIVDDLGLESSVVLAGLLKHLSKYGIKVLRNERGCASIDHESWERAKVIGEKYIEELGE